MLDAKAIAAETAKIVRRHVEDATSPLLKQITEQQRQFDDLKAARLVEKEDVLKIMREEIARAEDIRVAEHRAAIAEHNEALAALRLEVRERLLEVRDGKDGINGKDGAPGERGEAGPQGDQGERGEKGDKGDKGDPGEQGIAGERGLQGERGEKGDLGERGEQGERGLDGLQGERGEKGDAGDRGERGEPGADGRDGLDAYAGQAKGLYDPEAQYRAMDVVSLNGSEWRAKQDDPGPLPGDGWMLSAQRGQRGDKGVAGEKGERGQPGKDGAQPIKIHFDANDLTMKTVLDDGTVLDADFEPIARLIRGE